MIQSLYNTGVITVILTHVQTNKLLFQCKNLCFKPRLILLHLLG